MSKTGTLGMVISADTPSWHKANGGFVAGAKSVKPDIKFLQAQIGPAGYADAEGGKRVTETVIAGGADIVFGQGDGASFGMLQAVETAKPPAGADKVWFIDVIGDKTSIDEKGVLLSSVLWDFAGTFEQAIADINAGTFGNAGLRPGRRERRDRAARDRAHHPRGQDCRRHRQGGDRRRLDQGPDDHDPG